MGSVVTTVIIPARNEEKTIGAIVTAFNNHTETRGRVYVGLDADTTDDTGRVVWAQGGCAFHTNQRGKGQVVTSLIACLRANASLSNRIIICDGDYTGLTTDHIQDILNARMGMTIGIPDWPDISIPSHVTNAWPLVSGFRCLPWAMIPSDAHGYLLETQLNLTAIKQKIPIRHIFMEGLKSPFQWPLPIKRMEELKRDRKWGERNGIL